MSKHLGKFELTNKEIKVVQNIAKRMSDNQDLVFLSFFIKNEQNIVKLLEYQSFSKENFLFIEKDFKIPPEGLPVTKVQETEGGVIFTVETRKEKYE